MTYVRNASGLIRDKARLAHILLILFITIWMSNRTISGIIIQQSKGSQYDGGLIKLSRKYCMSKNASGSTDTNDAHTNVRATAVYINAILFDFVLTFSYFTALKTK